MNHSEIVTARHQLEKDRRDKVAELMEAYDKEHIAKIKKLRQECGGIGHNWRFSNLGPLGDPWFHCTVCGASRVDREEAA